MANLLIRENLYVFKYLKVRLLQRSSIFVVYTTAFKFFKVNLLIFKCIPVEFLF